VCLSRWRAKEEDADQTKRFFLHHSKWQTIEIFFLFFGV
jgi:hypothetical protein